MWPLNQPARTLLKTRGTSWITWATFDPSWYRMAYAQGSVLAAVTSTDAAWGRYLNVGQTLGHSPNITFDEAWHRRAYPGIAALVASGQYESTFDAYCRGGCLDRSPHWLFDEADYRQRHPDLTDAVLAERGLVNGYDHYLWRGNAEGRIGHPLFDPTVYRAQFPAEQADSITADGPFWHCLRRLDRNEPEVRMSHYFDPVWYLERYPEVAEAIARGTWRWALEHYLCNDTPTRFDPNPAFSEAYYLGRGAEVAMMVERGDFRNGFAHFLRHGVRERYSPHDTFDLAWYAAQPAVEQDLEHARAPDPFVHWLTIGRPLGLPSAAPPEQPITEAQAQTLFRHRAQTQTVLRGRTPLAFATTGAPTLSVIVVLHNQFALTLLALASLRANYPGEIELILVDSGSTDETRYIERYVRGAIILRFETNIGYLRGCNAALMIATADSVLYLNNDIELAPGAIDAALRRLDSDPGIGAVGGMVIRTHGVLQEAGGIVWRDGSTQGYLRDASPLTPEANFVRDVDFCSAVFLLVRRTLVSDLGGYDEAFAPAYYEDTDLCLRIAAVGFRVVYDPSVMIHHLDYGSGTNSRTAAAEMGRARQVFVRKHADYLASRPGRDKKAELMARATDTAAPRVLFIEDTVPLRMIGSGFVRSNDLVSTMVAIGCRVTVYPLDHRDFNLASVYADMPDSVEVMHQGSLAQLEAFLTERRDYYQAIWIARTHNLDGIRPMLERIYPASDARPLMVLDTEAIASVREAEKAALDGLSYDLVAAIRLELRNAAFCQKVLAVTESEAANLRDLGLPDVNVVGHMRPLRPTARSFEQRTGMLFVGAIHRMDSPNYDGLCWFVDEVLPLIETELGWQTRLTVVGYTGAEVNLDRFKDHPRITLRGAIPELNSLYDSHRVFIAPTRFAAGTPYKIYESASFGLPVVATDLLRNQLGWTAGQDLLTASADDPAAFARQLVSLQRDKDLWNHLRGSALTRLRDENSKDRYLAQVAGVLSTAE